MISQFVLHGGGSDPLFTGPRSPPEVSVGWVSGSEMSDSQVAPSRRQVPSDVRPVQPT